MVAQLSDGLNILAKINRVHPLSKGQRLTLNIDSLAPGGEGVGRAEGVPVFVNNAAIGDVIEVELYDVRKNFAKGKIVRLEVPSATRTEPACPLSDRCGGCQWQHIEYGAQLEAKRSIVEQAIKHVGRLEHVLVEPVLGAENPLRYRNKAQFPVGEISKPVVSSPVTLKKLARAGRYRRVPGGARTGRQGFALFQTRLF